MAKPAGRVALPEVGPFVWWVAQNSATDISGRGRDFSLLLQKSLAVPPDSETIPGAGGLVL